jgi:transposase-like protein
MAFQPKFCPHPDCPNHHHPSRSGAPWYVRNGRSLCRRTGFTQRYRCKRCLRFFSDSTFHLDYRTHHRLDYRRIFSSINSASGIRDVAREFRVTDKVILNRLTRLARQSMGLMARIALRLPIAEDMAIDGFESFVHSQYWPNNFTLAVGSDSQFVYGCDYAQMRRKGRMTSAQRRKRDRLNQSYPIAPGQISRSFRDVVDAIIYRWGAEPTGQSRILHTDEKLEYRQVLKSHQYWLEAAEQGLCRHERTSSRVLRTLSNPLFPVNYLDREIRKDQACHVRQSVQWSKSVNNTMERMMIYLAYHNCFKPYRIKDRRSTTHAEIAGVDRQWLEALKKRFFTQRVFVHQLVLDISQWKTWYRIWKTPVFELGIDLPAFAG